MYVQFSYLFSISNKSLLILNAWPTHLHAWPTQLQARPINLLAWPSHLRAWPINLHAWPSHLRPLIFLHSLVIYLHPRLSNATSLHIPLPLHGQLFSQSAWLIFWVTSNQHISSRRRLINP